MTRGTLLECFTRFVTSSHFLLGYGWWDSRSCTAGSGQNTPFSDFTSHEAVGVYMPDGVRRHTRPLCGLPLENRLRITLTVQTYIFQGMS